MPAAIPSLTISKRLRAIWRVECLAGALHNQDWQCWPPRRGDSSANDHRFSIETGTDARMAAAVSLSNSTRAAATNVRIARSCTMISRWSYNH